MAVEFVDTCLEANCPVIMIIQELVKLLLLTLLVLSLGVKSTVVSKASTPPYTITAIKAMLFYQDEGKFSQDVFTGSVNLWNEVAAQATLVVIEVKGQAFSYEPSRKVKLTAIYRYTYLSYNKVKRGAYIKRQVVVRKISELGVFTDEGKSYAAFWLNNTGCQPVTIKVRIMGQVQPSAMKKKILFKCSE